MEYVLNNMDAPDLRRFRVDFDNPEFQQEYMRQREIWTTGGRYNGGMERSDLFQLALKYQKSEVEEKPAKKTTKKELQPA